MILWRVSNFASIDGTGGLFVSGRWHTRGRLVVYCTLSPSTALLETLVHMEIDAEDRPERFQVLRIEGPDALSKEAVEVQSLPLNWAAEVLLTQGIGDLWLSQERSLLMEVPSALVPETWNVLLNPRHPEARLLKITKTYEHAFDARFF